MSKFYLNEMKKITIIVTILNKQMEAYFATMFEDIRHGRSLILLLSLTDPDKLRQTKFTDHEASIEKNLALENYTDNEY